MRETPGGPLLRAAARRVRGRLALLVALTAVQALAGLAVPPLLAGAVDAALRGSGAGREAVRLGAVLLAGGACEVAAALLAATCAARTAAWLRKRLVDRLLAAGPRSRVPHGEAVTQLAQAAVQAAELPTAASLWGVSTLGSAAAAVMLWLTDWRVGLAFTAGVPVAVLLARRFMSGSAEAQQRYLAAQGRIATRLLAALGGAHTIRASGTLAAETRRVLEPLAEVSAAGHGLWGLQRRVVWRFGLLLPAVEVAVLAVAGAGVAAQRISPGGLLAVAGYLAIATRAVEQIDSLFSFAQARAGAARVAGTLDVPVPEGGDALPGVPGRGALRFRGVVVRNGGDAVLDGVDLDLPAGASVALVGRSGGGKTLLASLVGRLRDPDEGEVLLDGVPVAALPLAELRARVAYAFERPVLVGATVAQAVSYGLPDAPGTRAAVERAARAAHADGFVRRLPLGYDTPLARAPMSGGERQRLGLARALARPALVHVLDDATSGLDTLTEADVVRSLTRHLDGRTRLVVAHRAGTAAGCDAVAWLDGGRVRAFGPHAELWRTDPDYRAVFSPGASGAGAGEPPPRPPREEAPAGLRGGTR
jgi:ATP-binding cassette subfamily B protein